jgi:hypothetical protein
MPKNRRSEYAIWRHRKVRAQSCPVCQRPDRPIIDAELRRKGIAAVSVAVGIGRGLLRRHADECD